MTDTRDPIRAALAELVEAHDSEDALIAEYNARIPKTGSFTFQFPDPVLSAASQRVFTAMRDARIALAAKAEPKSYESYCEGYRDGKDFAWANPRAATVMPAANEEPARIGHMKQAEREALGGDGVKALEALIQPARVWPFVESPGEFADRLALAHRVFDSDYLAAVRNVLIENPPVLAALRPTAPQPDEPSARDLIIYLVGIEATYAENARVALEALINRREMFAASPSPTSSAPAEPAK